MLGLVHFFKKKFCRIGAAIAQSIRLRHSCCGLEFDSHAQHRRFFNLASNCRLNLWLYSEKDWSKQKHAMGWSILKNSSRYRKAIISSADSMISRSGFHSKLNASVTNEIKWPFLYVPGWPFPASFYFHLFSAVLIQLIVSKICWWLD